MSDDQDTERFMIEFEALKARFGPAFADLKAVRFTGEGGYAEALTREFVPYSCREDSTGMIVCEKERPV